MADDVSINLFYLLFYPEQLSACIVQLRLSA